MMTPSRRVILQAAAGVATLAGAPSTGARASPAPAPLADAIDLARRQRSGETAPGDVLEAALASAAALDPKLGFLAASGAEAARARVRAAKPGTPTIPMLVKDLTDQAGLPTRYGSAAFAKSPPAKRDAAFTTGLQALNAVSIGKSATSEFGLSPVIEPIDGPPCRSPWDPTCSAGGSSGGAAAAVAAGVVPLAHGSDGGGSLRIPAALCGVFGFKPSRGRMIGRRPNGDPTDLVCDHVLTRSVRDSALVLAALQIDGGPLAPVPLMSGVDGAAKPLRIGVIEGSIIGRKPDAAVAAALEATQARLRAMGHTTDRVTWPFDGGRFADDFLALWALGAAQGVGDTQAAFGRAGVAALHPLTTDLAARATGIDGAALGQRLASAKAAYDGLFDGIDVLMTPVLTQAAIPIGSVPVRGDAAIDALRTIVGYTPIQNVAGAPAMSVPMGWTDAGFPIGLQFAGRQGDDAKLMALAFALEAQAPWAERRPAIRV